MQNSYFPYRNIRRRRINTHTRTLFTTLLIGSLLFLVSCGPQSGSSGNTAVQTSTSHLNLEITAIHMIDATRGWAYANNSNPFPRFILRTTDGGNHWNDVTPKASPVNPRSIAFDFPTVSNAWVMIQQPTQNGDVFKTSVFSTTDDGQSWQETTLSENNCAGGQIRFLNSEDGWIFFSILGDQTGTEAADIFRTTDAGKTWTKVSSTNSSPSALPLSGDNKSLTFLNKSTGWATGTAATKNFAWLYATHDGGQTWHHQTLPFPPGVTPGTLSVSPPTFFNEKDGMLFVGGFNSGEGTDPNPYMYVTHDGGATWHSTTIQSISKGAPKPIDMNHWLTADTDSLYATSNEGENWTNITPSISFQNILETDVVSNKIGWIIASIYANTRIILKTVDGGHTWTQINYTIS